MLSCRASLSGAHEASPMEGVTGTMAWLGCVPGKRRGGLEPVEHLPFFRIPDLAEMEAASFTRVAVFCLHATFWRYAS